MCHHPLNNDAPLLSIYEFFSSVKKKKLGLTAAEETTGLK